MQEVECQDYMIYLVWEEEGIGRVALLVHLQELLSFSSINALFISSGVYFLALSCNQAQLMAKWSTQGLKISVFIVYTIRHLKLACNETSQPQATVHTVHINRLSILIEALSLNF